MQMQNGRRIGEVAMPLMGNFGAIEKRASP